MAAGTIFPHRIPVPLLAHCQGPVRLGERGAGPYTPAPLPDPISTIRSSLTSAIDRSGRGLHPLPDAPLAGAPLALAAGQRGRARTRARLRRGVRCRHPPHLGVDGIGQRRVHPRTVGRDGGNLGHRHPLGRHHLPAAPPHWPQRRVRGAVHRCPRRLSRPRLAGGRNQTPRASRRRPHRRRVATPPRHAPAPGRSPCRIADGPGSPRSQRLRRPVVGGHPP